MEAIFTALILGSFGLIGWTNHLRNQRYHVAVQAKTVRFNKIIDRFSADEELLKFLQSEKGQATLNKIVAAGKGFACCLKPSLFSFIPSTRMTTMR